MSISINEINADLGPTLAELRNAADLKQADIAKSLNGDQSRVSCIEEGVVTPTESEVEGYLTAVGTDDAKAYREFLKLRWEHLERPSFWHPQRNALCKAEIYLQKLEELKSQSDLPKLLLNQAQMYGNTLRREAKYLTSLKHSITFIGRIGVGKTTFISKLTGLVIPQTIKPGDEIVLETGAGGTTVCEVRIQQGDKFGIFVEPQAEEEINKIVEDLCAVCKNSNEGEQKDKQTNVSKEMDRLIRNMTGLVKEKRENAYGKKEIFDPLIDLANRCDDADTLRLELLDRMKLQERNRRKIWFEGTSEQTDLAWLKNKFADINYGRDHEFPFPQRIDVIVPDKVIQSSYDLDISYELDIVDTKGIEGDYKEATANRPDIRQYIDDSRTLTVFCSRFTDAPDPIFENLIDKLSETRSEGGLKERVVFLLLPRNGEALDMKDDAGYKVEIEEEGYELKQQQVQERLQQKDNVASDIPIFCFNAASDEPKQIIAELIEQLEKLRKSHIDRLENTGQALDVLIKNQEEENAQKAQKEVVKFLEIFVDQNRSLSKYNRRVHNYLEGDLRETHPRKIWATTRRRGMWNNLNIYFLLGDGARNIAWNLTRQAFWGLKERLKNERANPSLKPVHNLLEELLANWEVWYEDFLQSVQQDGEQIFKPKLVSSFDWKTCADAYGSELKYNKLVINKLRAWFDTTQQEHLHELLNTRIEKAWREKVLIQLEQLTDEGVDTE